MSRETEERASATNDGAQRDEARRRVARRREREERTFAWVTLNVLMITLWAFGGRGYFWPAWVLAPTTVFLLLDWWRPEITEGDVDDELRRMRSRRG